MADPGATSPRKPPTRRAAGAPHARTPVPLRGRLPAIAPAAAATLRGIFSEPRTWSLSHEAVLQFMPGRPVAAGQLFEIDAEGTRIGLALRRPRHDDGPHWSDYQGRSRVLAWSLAHEAELMRLSEAFGVVLTPLPDTAPAETSGTELWLDFIVDEAPAQDTSSRMPVLQGALRAPLDWTERLLERADPPDGHPAPLDGWRGLGVAIALRWSVAPLPWAEWAALRPGDVLVLGRRSQPPPAEAHAGGLAWPLTPGAEGWRISGPPRHIRIPLQETSPMNDLPATGDAGDASDPDALARRLPVDLAFELGRTELRVGELSQLQPGYVFPLAGALEGANVTIRANGQAVGQGELVAVGDSLGVRLLGWS
jgi:type III secretion system YscQ/HrcQ family protein